MTLLIACLLIYHMELSPVWYVMATFLWFVHAVYHADKKD